MDGKRVVVDEALPTAFGSLFGRLIIGPVFNTSTDQLHSNVVSLAVSLEEIVQRFWQVEEPYAAPATFTKEGKYEAIYVSERKRHDGRFLVPLPFINDQPESFLGSQQVALRRFQNLECKLQTNESLYEAYRKFMAEYESLGHMSAASKPGSYYIPHHPIFKSASMDKIRVVFDASATAVSKLLLNQCLYTGPKL